MAQILYVHGSGHTHEAFAQQAAAFPGSDAVSLPGHPHGAPLGDVSEMASWLAEYARFRAAVPAIACGNSLGAAIAIEWALTNESEVAGLILIGSGARLRVGKQIFEMIDLRWPDCIDDLVDLSVAPACADDLRRLVRGWHLMVGQSATRADYAACDRFDEIERVAKIAVPTLIIVGALDRMTPPKYAAFLHERIAQSTLSTIDGAGHLPHLEQPDAVNAVIRAWLAEVS
jgi:pimeloyl-ACP methyl ester carboxylesterase